MEITVTAYNNAMYLLTVGLVWDAVTVKCSLHTSAYVFDATHFAYNDLTDELVDASYTAGGKALTNEEISIDETNHEVMCDADDIGWTALSGIFRYAVIRVDDGNPTDLALLFLIDFGEDIVCSAEDFKIALNTLGLFRLRQGA
jgi:hypothetical protein